MYQGRRYKIGNINNIIDTLEKKKPPRICKKIIFSIQKLTKSSPNEIR